MRSVSSYLIQILFAIICFFVIWGFVMDRINKMVEIGKGVGKPKINESEFYSAEECKVYFNRMKTLIEKGFNTGEYLRYKNEIYKDAIRNNCRENKFGIDAVNEFNKHIADEPRCEAIKSMAEKRLIKHIDYSPEYFKDSSEILSIVRRNNCEYVP